MAQEGEEKKVLMTKKGNRVVCFNQKCKGKDDNHYIHSCPRANEKERKEIMAWGGRDTWRHCISRG